MRGERELKCLNTVKMQYFVKMANLCKTHYT